MMKGLLWRGMLAGLLAALVAATFARVVAEPSIGAAIAIEGRHEAHGALAHEPAGHEEEVVSRATQQGVGLFTAMALYGAAMGGLLAIVFAASYGRIGIPGPRGLALMLGVAAFLVLVLVPAIKYPPNPPAVGLAETIGVRTAGFFTMLAASAAAAWAAALAFRRLGGMRAIDRLAIPIAGYAVLAATAAGFLPAFDEVPADFPASLLWRFRIEALGTQALFWILVGYLFGAMAERQLRTAAAR